MTSDGNIWLQMIDEPLPVESTGECANYRNCRSERPTVLGDGYCLRCWDIGVPHRKNKAAQREVS